MLEQLSPFPVDGQIVRLANMFDLNETLRSLNLNPDEIREVLDEVGEGSQPKPDDLLDAPFRPKPRLDTTTLYPKTRYSDGNHPVFYGAVEQETAEEEVKHHFVEDLVRSSSGLRTVFFDCLKCRVRGTTKDLRPKLPEWPGLISNNYSFCQSLGREVVDQGLDGFIAPSARREDGTTVPVFRREALSEAHVVGRVAFSLDHGTNEVVAYTTP